ncbi:peroxisomal (S)-2-hydroxy-acid oxidase GLO3 [Ixodes scapularis]|uniref:peroxisomal (S)-2-hydroxy-acid oxidase GLO3 n=1 Tax=Ixodes scapularis TaxID=6945 RepID=UPI001C3927E8|nr:peroxisomal (S)-2-hydroxy-acid oxidase GLO3 [Ixodes scapularis]
MRILLCVVYAVGLVQAAPDKCKPEDTVSTGDNVPITVDDIERMALKNLDDGPRAYYQDGSEEQQTLKENMEAFRRLRLRPRVLRGVKHRDMTVTLLGRQRLSMPLGIAPAAMQKMAHPDGEEATARAAEKAGTVMILSTLTTASLEDVRKAAPHAVLWYQLYIIRDRELSRRLVKRAERAGYSAIVLTVDSPTLGRKFSDVRGRFRLPSHLKLANFNAKEQATLTLCGSDLHVFGNSLLDPSLTWTDVQWLKNITHLPIILKGILTAEDAVLAVRSGIPAIIVSNHGGRQLDGVASTIEILPKIMRAVHGHIDVYLDGGVRQGTDVVKALALGAKMVFVGRPALWGLAYKGQQGVEDMLRMFREEIDRAMALMGCPTLADLQPQMVARREYYASL